MKFFQEESAQTPFMCVLHVPPFSTFSRSSIINRFRGRGVIFCVCACMCGCTCGCTCGCMCVCISTVLRTSPSLFFGLFQESMTTADDILSFFSPQLCAGRYRRRDNLKMSKFVGPAEEFSSSSLGTKSN